MNFLENRKKMFVICKLENIINIIFINILKSICHEFSNTPKVFKKWKQKTHVNYTRIINQIVSK